MQESTVQGSCSLLQYLCDWWRLPLPKALDLQGALQLPAAEHGGMCLVFPEVSGVGRGQFERVGSCAKDLQISCL